MSSSPRLRLAAAAIAAFTLVAGAGCGSGGRAGDGAATATTVHDHDAHSHKPAMDPCRLLTTKDATVAVGPVISLVENTGEGQAPIPDSRICAVALEGNKLAAHVGFTEEDVRRKYLSYTQRFAKAAEPIESLGDYAAWVSIFRLLLVLDGGELLSVQMLDPEEDLNAARDKAVKLAAAAVPRLPGEAKSSSKK